jgi:hypothetical protein
MNTDEVKTQIKALQDMLSKALDEAKSLNNQADGVVDRGLDTIEKSPYTPQIVFGIAIVMLTVGGVMGWAAKAFMG